MHVLLFCINSDFQVESVFLKFSPKENERSGRYILLGDLNFSTFKN